MLKIKSLNIEHFGNYIDDNNIKSFIFSPHFDEKRFINIALQMCDNLKELNILVKKSMKEYNPECNAMRYDYKGETILVIIPPDSMRKSLNNN